MKRVVGSSFFAVFLLLLVAAAYFYFQAQKEDRGSVLMAVPSDALFLLTCHPGSGELRQLGQSDFLANRNPESWESRSSRALIEFDSLSNNNAKWSRIFEQSPLHVSGHFSGSGEVGVIYYIHVNQSLVPSLDKLCQSLVDARGQVGVRRFGQTEIRDLKAADGRIFAWTISEGVFICTFTPYLLEDALRQQAQEGSSTLVAAMPGFIEESGNSLNIAVRYSYIARFLQSQVKREYGGLLKPLSRFGEWTILTLDIVKETIVFHGQTLPADSFSFVSLFATQRPVEWSITRKMPDNAVSCIAWAMDDPEEFIQQLNREGVAARPEDVRLMEYFKPWVGKEMAMIVQRQLTDSLRDQPLAIFRLRNQQACRSYLRILEGETSSREELYHGASIRLIQRTGILKSVFGPVFEPVNRFYYSIIDDCLVVANQASALRGYIDAVKSGHLLSSDPKFRQNLSKIPQKGNVLFYVDLSMFQHGTSGYLGSTTTSWFPEVASGAHRLGVFLFSLHQSNGIFLTQGVLSHTGATTDSVAVN